MPSVCVQDKVNISVAIIPMAEDFGWSSTVSGLVQSSFFFGYMLTQIPGGYIIAKKGGRKILPLGVGLWSLATAAVPVMAGTMPGRRCLFLPSTAGKIVRLWFGERFPVCLGLHVTCGVSKLRLTCITLMHALGLVCATSTS